MRLYLLRHGETDWNVGRRLQGLIDTPLNPKGMKQAAGWRPYFDRIRLAAIYSSSLTRAIDTAALATGQIVMTAAVLLVTGLLTRRIWWTKRA